MNTMPEAATRLDGWTEWLSHEKSGVLDGRRVDFRHVGTWPVYCGECKIEIEVVWSSCQIVPDQKTFGNRG
jgi:hypothetical protein